jgi:hypothetical protein
MPNMPFHMNKSALSHPPMHVDEAVRFRVRRKLTGASGTGNMPLAEVGLWSLLFLIAAGFNVARNHQPVLGNDPYQYLSIAENIRDHREIATSLVHFDAERLSGKIPAPSVTFPPGYPILISAVSLLGCSLLTAGLSISLLSGIAIIPLLCVATNVLDIPLPLTRICVALWLLNSYALLYSGGILSEPVFTLLTFAAIVLLLSHESSADNRKNGWLLVSAFVLAGLAYWMRYAGLFLFVAMVLYGFAQYAVHRRLVMRWLGAMAVGGGIIIAGFLRNISLTGSWQGGQPQNPHRSALQVAEALGAASYHLFLGALPVFSGLAHGLAEVAAGVGALALLAAWASMLVSGSVRPRLPERRLRGISLLAFYVVIYATGIFYLGHVAPIELNPRMVFPLLPILLVFAMWVWWVFAGRHFRVKAWHRVAIVLFLFGYGTMNIQSLRMPLTYPHQIVSRWLGMRTETGQTLLAWINHNISQKAVIVSEEGQATGYVLHRDTVSLVAPVYSHALWNDRQIHNVMDAFHADYLFVYTAPDIGVVEQHEDSPFLQQLALTEESAPWLQLAAENPRVKIYRRRF